MTRSKSDECCNCRPYNDGLLTTAQVLSILAVFLSWGTFLTLILGIVSFLCLQIVWCCRMRRCGLITTGIFSLISGVCSVVVGILVLVSGADTLCEDAYNDGTQNGYHFNMNSFKNDCNVGVNTFASVAIVGGALWLVISVLIFVFSCGSRYDAYLLEREQKDKDVVIMVQQNQTAGRERSRAVNSGVAGDKV